MDAFICDGETSPYDEPSWLSKHIALRDPIQPPRSTFETFLPRVGEDSYVRGWEVEDGLSEMNLGAWDHGGLLKLPVELLSEIFLYACTGPPIQFKTLSSITEVCRGWYAIAVDIPVLWNEIRIVPGHMPTAPLCIDFGVVSRPETVRRRIERAGPAQPLTFHIQLPEMCTPLSGIFAHPDIPLYPHLLQLVLATHRQIKELSLVVGPHCDSNPDIPHPYCTHGIADMVLRYLSLHPAPILRKLAISEGYRSMELGDEECTPWPVVDDGWTLPSLEELRLCGNVGDMIPPGIWRATNYVQISGTRWSLTRLISNLMHCVELRVLAIELPNTTFDVLNGAEFRFPALRSLRICRITYPADMQTVRCFRTPQLRYLTMEGAGDLRRADLATILGSVKALAQLRVLRLRYMNGISNEGLNEIISCCTGLQELLLSAYWTQNISLACIADRLEQEEHGPFQLSFHQRYGSGDLHANPEWRRLRQMAIPRAGAGEGHLEFASSPGFTGPAATSVENAIATGWFSYVPKGYSTSMQDSE